MASKRKAKAKEEKVPLMILTNERTQFKANILMMMYQAASYGQLAYMDGMDPDTGEIVPLLVGLEPAGDGDKMNVHPLAKLLHKNIDDMHYLIPDGQGNYFDGRNDTAALQEEARPTEQ